MNKNQSIKKIFNAYIEKFGLYKFSSLFRMKNFCISDYRRRRLYEEIVSEMCQWCYRTSIKTYDKEFFKNMSKDEICNFIERDFTNCSHCGKEIKVYL